MKKNQRNDVMRISSHVKFLVAHGASALRQCLAALDLSARLTRCMGKKGRVELEEGDIVVPVASVI